MPFDRPDQRGWGVKSILKGRGITRFKQAYVHPVPGSGDLALASSPLAETSHHREPQFPGGHQVQRRSRRAGWVFYVCPCLSVRLARFPLSIYFLGDIFAKGDEAFLRACRVTRISSSVSSYGVGEDGPVALGRCGISFPPAGGGDCHRGRRGEASAGTAPTAQRAPLGA